ncbi:MAG TPA: FAD-dependent oxidoreductase, partial [Nevskiaceae bacterium]|nr:FAD-dependent oxidoreductase [Nevskiaceae bacterium]
MASDSLLQEADVVVVGSGAGGLTAAVRAADLGLSVQVVEKTHLVGGTTALSGGDLWVPCNFDQKQAGVQDDLNDAFRYVKTSARGLATDDRVLAYVETAKKTVAYLHSIGVHYRCVPLYSDYYPPIDGSRPGGRTMDPSGFDARQLGVDG